MLVSLLLSSLVPVLVSLLLSSFFPQDRGSVPSCFAGSSWFRLGFRCLSPFFSLLLSSGKGFCSIMICWLLLVPAGSGACLPSSLDFLSSGKSFCSIMICWFLLVPAGVLVLVSLLLSSFFPQEEVLFHHDLLVLLGSRWGSGACLPFSLFFDSGACLPSSLIFLSSGKGLGVLFHHDLLVLPGSGWGSGWGSGACLPSFLFFLSSGQGFCSIMICWLLLVRVGFRCCLPSSLFFGSGVCLPSSLFFLSSGQGFCPIMICWFLLVPAWVPVLVSLLLWFRCLSPFFSLLLSSGKGFCSIMICWLLLVPAGSGACLPSSLAFLSSGKGFCSIMICWFLLVPAGVPVLVSLLLSSFFPQERGSVPS